MNPIQKPATQAGTTMIEILVTIVIVSIGLLGLAALQARASNAEFESYQRSQALVLVSDMVERIHMNRANKGSFMSISDADTGSGYLGATGSDSYSISCSAPSTRAITDLCDWSSLLEGSAETLSGSAVGAMIGARGCVSYDASTALTGIADSGLFTVAVSWQGVLDTAAPTVNCANNLYGSEAKRRTVSTSFRLAVLN